MDTFFYSELKEKCQEIYIFGKDPEWAKEVISAGERMVHLSDCARKEGLLELSFEAEKFDCTKETLKYLSFLIDLVLDGTEPRMVYELGMSRFVTAGFEDYDGLIALMYLQGALMLQAGDTPHLVEQMVVSMQPDFISDMCLGKSVDE